MAGDPRDCFPFNSCYEAYQSQYLKQTPYKCPICEGKGIVPNGFYSVYGSGTTTDASPETCKSCYGSGILWR
jgi:hypothetical protein